MTRRRWVFGAVAVAGVVALVIPAVGQGKAASTSLRWSASRGGAALTSYDFGEVAGRARVSTGFRLGNSALVKSGRLKISLTGSSAFSITSDKCTRKSIGKLLSCWVGVALADVQAGTSDSATLTATGEHGAAASLSLSGHCTATSASSAHVYWANARWDAGTVKTIPVGGGCVTTLATGQHNPLSVAADGTHVYWTTWGPGVAGTVNEVPVDGGSVTILATSPGRTTSVVVHGSGVYWVDLDGATSVNEVPVGGGSVTTLASGYVTEVLAVDDAHVYMGGAGTVAEVPVGGGSVTTLATGQRTVAMAVRGAYLYWCNSNDGAVNEVPVGGGSVTTLASGQSLGSGFGTSSLAVDGTHVYWVDYYGGKVNEVALGGGSVVTLASGQNGPSSVAVDGKYVYWTNWGSGSPLGDGTVNRVPVGGGPVTTLAAGQHPPVSLAVGP
jgi:hypothetical protein